MKNKRILVLGVALFIFTLFIGGVFASGLVSVDCPRCDGYGKVRCDCNNGYRTVFDHETKSYIEEKCGYCGGSGWTYCRSCDGRGKVMQWQD